MFSTAETDLELLVEHRMTAADDVVVLTLTGAAGGELPAWEPGAHIDLMLRPDLVRQYSLCGDPADGETWRVAILLEPDSRGGSRFVFDELLPGRTVRVRGPRNNFPLLASERYLFVAGGVGITPIMPMLGAAEAAAAEWRLVYGGRSRASMAFREQLVAAYGEKVVLCPQDETGLLELAPLLGEPEAKTLVYCCGPEPLLRAVEEECASWPPGSLHVERFAAKGVGEPVLGDSFEVELRQQGMTLVVPRERSILQVVEDAGVQVPSSCAEGTCGTCETGVLDGVPDHRDSLLTKQERAAMDTMMICVSRSCTPRLTLDL